MDEIELEKETYEKVVSLIQSGKKHKALKAILPEANEDKTLANSILKAIETSVSRKSSSSSAKEKKAGKKKKKKSNDSAKEGESSIDEIELDKETYETVVSLIQSGKKAEALETILPETDEDPALAKSILKAIESSLSGKAKSTSAEGKEERETKKDKEKTDSSEPEDSPTTSIPLPGESSSDQGRKGTLIGSHKGIEEIELEKETYLHVVDRIESGEREAALDLILEEANQSKSLAEKVLKAIEKDLRDQPSSSLDSESKSAEEEKPEEKKEPNQKSEESGEKALEGESELDPVERAKKEIRRTAWIVFFLGGFPGFLLFRSGMRPRRAILANLVLCLLVGLVVWYFFYPGRLNGGLSGSGNSRQDVMNYVAVAMCPLLADDLDLHSGQRSTCYRIRNRFAYHLYDESRKIAGFETIRGPFSEEDLEAGLLALGKEIEGELNRKQRGQFQQLYETSQWPPVDIKKEAGRFRLVYPNYGNAPGVLRLSVDSRE